MTVWEFRRRLIDARMTQKDMAKELSLTEERLSNYLRPIKGVAKEDWELPPILAEQIEAVLDRMTAGA